MGSSISITCEPPVAEAGSSVSVVVRVQPPNPAALISVSVLTPLGDVVIPPALLTSSDGGATYQGNIDLQLVSRGLYAVNAADGDAGSVQADWIVVLTPEEINKALPLLAEAFDLRGAAATASARKDFDEALTLDQQALATYRRGGYSVLADEAEKEIATRSDDGHALALTLPTDSARRGAIRYRRRRLLFKATDPRPLATSVLLNTPAVILSKVRDLEFAKKVGRVSSHKIDGKNGVLLCLVSTRKYVAHVASAVADTRLERHRGRCLSRIDELITKVDTIASVADSGGQGRPTRLDPKVVTRAVVAYRNFRKVMLTAPVEKSDVVPRWREMVSMAQHVWDDAGF